MKKVVLSLLMLLCLTGCTVTQVPNEDNSITYTLKDDSEYEWVTYCTGPINGNCIVEEHKLPILDLPKETRLPVQMLEYDCYSHKHFLICFRKDTVNNEV